MKLTQLKYFKTVAECGRISVASKKLFISPPALSTALLKLENELGVALFDRSSNQIVLNEQGRIFLRYVNQIFNSLDCAQLEMESSLQKSSNSIHVAVTTSSIWISLLSAFAVEHPDISLSCDTLKISQLVSSKLSSEYSFVLAERSDFAAAELDGAFLFEEDLVAFVPKGHPLATRKELRLNDLSNEILFLPITGQSFNKRITQLFADHHLVLRHAHEFSDSTCLTMVSEGRGICFGTSNNIRSQVKDVVCIPIAVPECHWEQWLYWQPHRQFTPEEIAFKNFVLKMYHTPK